MRLFHLQQTNILELLHNAKMNAVVSRGQEESMMMNNGMDAQSSIQPGTYFPKKRSNLRWRNKLFLPFYTLPSIEYETLLPIYTESQWYR